MKQIIAGIFLLLYGVALLRPVLPVLDYAVDLQTYQALCRNQDRPQLKCNGKCILAEKIAAMDAQTSQPEAPVPPTVEVEEWVLACTRPLSAPLMEELVRPSFEHPEMLGRAQFTADLPTPPPQA